MPAEARRASILDAAREVFSRSGLAGARTKEIAKTAGVTEALLYKHFASKEEIFEEAVALPIEEAVRRITERPFHAPSPDTGTEVMRGRTVDFFEELLVSMQEIGPLLGVALFADSDRGVRYYRAHIEPAFAGIAALTRDTIRDWRHSDFNDELFARMVVGLCWTMALDTRLGSGKPTDTRRLAEEMTDILFDGIAAD
jgi:TetR/AcrR family transcriptional regulator